MLRLVLLLLAGVFQGSGALPPFGRSLRPYFFFPNATIQFNHGAYGSTPRPVVEAQYEAVARMEASIDEWMNGPTGYRQCILAARTIFSSMIGTPLNDTVLVDNASEAINAILRNFEPPLGADEYLFDLSTAYGPFQGLYEWMGSRTGMQVLTANVSWPVTGPESFVDPVRATLAYAAANSLNVRVAVISHISAYPSVLLPVRQLVELFHSYSIPVVVDGAHALGNIAFDVVGELGNPEYWFGNAHKWYLASKSSCVLYVRRDRQLPHVPAPAVVDNVETQDFPDRFIWTGTRDRTPYCAIQAATAFREALGGEAAVVGYNVGLARWAEAYLRQLWAVPPMAPPDMHTSMSIVQIPTSNATVCGIVRSTLFAQGWSVSGWNEVGNPPIACCESLHCRTTTCTSMLSLFLWLTKLAPLLSHAFFYCVKIPLSLLPKRLSAVCTGVPRAAGLYGPGSTCA